MYQSFLLADVSAFAVTDYEERHIRHYACAGDEISVIIDND